MKKFVLLVVLLFSLAFTACGGEDDKYTTSCKEIGNTGSDIQSCAKALRKTEKEFKNWEEPTTEETEKALGLESGSLSSSE